MRYADGPTTEATARVAAPPRAVWDLVTDPGFLARVSTEMQRASWGEGDEPGLGARLHGHHRHDAIGAKGGHAVAGSEPMAMAVTAVAPASTGTTAPVIQRALPEARNATAAPTSQPLPSVCRMERRRRASRVSGDMPPACTIGV